jgi:hypothetical protein
VVNPGQLVESYKFWEVVTLWAKDRLEHERVIARSLAHGVIVDGLRLYSVDPRWLREDESLSGHPYIGYAAQGGEPILLRAPVLEHLLGVARAAAEPSRSILQDEFIRRRDFRDWLVATDQSLPSFWFTEEEASDARESSRSGESAVGLVERLG